MDNLTPGEQRTFMLGLFCATDGLTNIKVDYDKLAEKAGLKNAASASVLFNKSRRKILLALTENSGGVAANGTPKKVATGDKVTKSRKSTAKGKGATNGVHIEELNEDADADTKINSGKAPNGKGGKGRTGVKVKPERKGMAPIKHETFIKEEPLIDKFAKVGALSSGNGTTASGSPLDSELDDESV